MKTGKRHIKNGDEFNELFPPVKGAFKLIKKVANLDDTIQLMKKVVATTLEDTQPLAESLKGSTQQQTCANIWNFCFNYLQYTKDEMGKEQVRRPARTWQDRAKGVDCDCMSVFIGSVLTNLDTPFSFRLTKYQANEFEHVYIIAHTNNGILILDAVVHEFNREVPYSAKKDITMELEYLNGFEDENENFDPNYEAEELEELEELIDNDYPMDAQGLLMDDDLQGLEGRAERRARRSARRTKRTTRRDQRKVKRQTRKTVRKDRREATRGLPRRERIKVRLKRGLHLVNRLNPAAALLRIGVLASMKLNIMKVASKLRFGYWSESEAKRNQMDMSKFQQLNRIRVKLEKIFFGAGGKTENLKKAILSGRGNRNRKVVLNGLGEIISPIYDEDDIQTILGDELYADEMIEEGINGLGEVATATAITAASGVIGTLALLIKRLGSLFKKGTPQAEQEMVQDNTDNQEEKTRKFSFKNILSRFKKKQNDSPIKTREPYAAQELEDYSTTADAGSDGSAEDDPDNKKGVVDWVKDNPLLTAGIATVAVGGTILAVKAMTGKKKGLSGTPKARSSKKKGTIAKKGNIATKSKKRKSPVRKTTVKKVELL